MKKLYSALLASLLSASILTACSATNVNSKKDVEFYSTEDEAFENAKKSLQEYKILSVKANM